MITRDSEPTQTIKSLLDLRLLYQEQINEILNLSGKLNITKASSQDIDFKYYL